MEKPTEVSIPETRTKVVCEVVAQWQAEGAMD